MPYTLNGVGTWYWGKRNLQTRMGACELCGHYGELKSYDTTLYFVVVFLPVIPLGKKRIMDECPSCQRHREMGLKAYHAARAQALTDGIRAMREAPQDPAVAAETLRTLVAYQDWSNFDKLAPAVGRTFARDKELQALVAEGHMFFNQYAEAEAAWRQALLIENDPGFRQRLAVALIRLGRSSEAEPHLAPILAERQKDSIGLLTFLIEGYQAEGQHGAALSVLDRLVSTWPELAGDKEWRTHRKISEKHAGKVKPVRSRLLAAPRAGLGGGTGRDVTGGFAKALLPAVAILALAGYLFWCWQEGLSRTFHVLNGTGQAYAVTINGQLVRLRPGGRMTVQLPEGTWRIEPDEGAAGWVKAASVSVQSPFFLRPFQSSTRVLNPDCMAILVKEWTTYSVITGPEGKEPPRKFYCGEAFYDIQAVDYAFRDFPPKLTVSDSRARMSKSRLYMEPPPPPTVYTLLGLKEALGTDRMVDYMARRAGQEPAESLWLLGFASYAKPDRVIETVRPRLGDRPVRVEWHRVYQGAMEKLHPEVDLAAEYRQLAENEPGEFIFKYLLGRILPDRKEAERLFEESERGARPVGYGHHALAYDRLCQGDFKGAAERAEKALAAIPGNLQAQSTRAMALEYCGEYGRLLAAVREEVSDGGDNVNVAIQEYGWLKCLGKAAEADERLNRYLAGHSKELPPEGGAAIRNIAQAVAASRTGVTGEYARLCTVIGGPTWTFGGALARLDADAASGAVEKLETIEYSDHLMVYILAMREGNAVLAGKHWKQAMDLIRATGAFDRIVLQAVLADRLEDPQTLVDAQILPRPKSILLTAFGFAHPAHRQILFEKAGRLNAQVDYLRPLLAGILAGRE